MDTTSQHLKDIRLEMEFKYLMNHAPQGVYVLPEFDNIRTLHGVIFVRRGFFHDGVFRFRIDLPANYNEFNAHPIVTFTPPIFNPLVDPITGQLDLTIDEKLQEWHPERHFIITAITFVKKIFYMKSYDGFMRIPNQEAKYLFDTNKDEFLIKVEQTVKESLTRVYDMPAPVNPLVFTEPKPAHQEMVESTIYRKRMQTSAQTASATNSAQKNRITDDEDDNRLTSSFFRSRMDETEFPSAAHRNNMDGAIAEMEKLVQDTDLSGDLTSPSPAKVINREQVVSPNDISVDSIDRPMSIHDL